MSDLVMRTIEREAAAGDGLAALRLVFERSRLGSIEAEIFGVVREVATRSPTAPWHVVCLFIPRTLRRVFRGAVRAAAKAVWLEARVAVVRELNRKNLVELIERRSVGEWDGRLHAALTELQGRARLRLVDLEGIWATAKRLPLDGYETVGESSPRYRSTSTFCEVARLDEQRVAVRCERGWRIRFVVIDCELAA
jgi:hypothetical protein